MEERKEVHLMEEKETAKAVETEAEKASKTDVETNASETTQQPQESPDKNDCDTVDSTDTVEKTAEETSEKKDDKKKKKKEKKDELVKLQESLEDQKDSYLRLAAEYQNYRNRTTEEKKKIYGDAKVDCAKGLLDVMDSFERALEATCADENYKKGIEMTFAQLQKVFEKLGVEEIPALGEAFDPNVHNAIKQVDDSEKESDTVCEVFQKGYKLGGRLIRPAMVAVAV